jgi:hypothetical protein
MKLSVERQHEHLAVALLPRMGNAKHYQHAQQRVRVGVCEATAHNDATPVSQRL